MSMNGVMTKMMSRKFQLTIMLFVAGTALAFLRDSTLVEYTAFGSFLLSIYAGADVTDKKLNISGNHDSQPAG